MSLMRMAGLIGFSVAATTFQANARPALLETPQNPARQQSPARNTQPYRELEQQRPKRELILVIAPQTSAWSDSAERLLLDESRPGPDIEPMLVSIPPADFGPTMAPHALESGAADRPVQATRAWLMARYPHAPPA